MKKRRLRDWQRMKVYRAERAWQSWVHAEGYELKFDSIPEVQDYVNWLYRSRWFEKEWESRVRRHDAPKVERYGGYAMCLGDSSAIYLSHWGFRQAIVLHEAAHGLMMRASKDGYEAPHGRDFCATMLRMVENQMGAEAARRLKEEYDARGVLYEGSDSLHYMKLKGMI